MPEEIGFVVNAEELFSSPYKRRFKVVGPLPVSGKRLRIQSLTERELSSYQALAVGKDGMKPQRIEDGNRRLIAICLVDADGNRLLTNEQAVKLAQLDSADSNFLYNECAAHVGLKRDDLENMEKNSEAPTASD